MTSAAPDRLASLDLIRGVAVLGILTVNIAGFAGPVDAIYSPDVPHPGSVADSAAFTVMLVLFEGKMRAIFSLLFGASLLLFVEREEDEGRDGQLLQLRRLIWLGLLGYLHYLLLWWGDILFTYAIAGMAALALRQMPARAMLATALLLFTAWQLEGIAASLTSGLAEATAAAGELQQYRGGFFQLVETKLANRPFFPLAVAFETVGETLSYMLLGMALLRSGFFTGGWTAARLRRAAIAGTGLGGALTLAFALWAWRHDFPGAAMRLAIDHALGFPHLLMALGYAAMLVLAAPRSVATGLGMRLRAAGRMALSNYMGTSLLMTAIFYGWGLGLFGMFGHAAQLPFVLLGWAVMLAWSMPWLSRFRMGPLEWFWRSLADRRMLKMRR